MFYLYIVFLSVFLLAYIIVDANCYYVWTRPCASAISLHAAY